MEEFIVWALTIGNPSLAEIRAIWGSTKLLDKAIAEGRLEWSTLQPGFLTEPIGANVPEIVALRAEISRLQNKLQKLIQNLIIEPTLNQLSQDYKALILAGLDRDPQLVNLVRHAITFKDFSAFQKAVPSCWLFEHRLNKPEENEARLKVFFPDKAARETFLANNPKPLPELLNALVNDPDSLMLVNDVFYTFRVMRTVLDLQADYDRDYELWYIGVLEAVGLWKAIANGRVGFKKELSYQTLKTAYGVLEYGNQSMANLIDFLVALGLLNKQSPPEVQPVPLEELNYYPHLLQTSANSHSEYPNDSLKRVAAEFFHAIIK